MMTQVTQTLKLEDTPKINSRFFEEGERLYAHTFAGAEDCARQGPCVTAWLHAGPRETSAD